MKKKKKSTWLYIKGIVIYLLCLGVAFLAWLLISYHLQGPGEEISSIIDMTQCAIAEVSDTVSA